MAHRLPSWAVDCSQITARREVGKFGIMGVQDSAESSESWVSRILSRILWDSAKSATTTLIHEICGLTHTQDANLVRTRTDFPTSADLLCCQLVRSPIFGWARC